MVRVGSFLLASALGAQTLWAASIPNTPHGERDVRPRIKRGTKFSPAYYCPDMYVLLSLLLLHPFVH